MQELADSALVLAHTAQSILGSDPPGLASQKSPRSERVVADFRDGEGMAREWIAGRGDLPDLLHVVRDMPRGGELGGLEAGFLSTIDAAVRGDRLDAANVPDPATAQQLLEASPSPEAVSAPVDLEAFHRRRRERERAARFEDLARRNAALF
jgi:hypothetical protein